MLPLTKLLEYNSMSDRFFAKTTCSITSLSRFFPDSCLVRQASIEVKRKQPDPIVGPFHGELLPEGNSFEDLPDEELGTNALAAHTKNENNRQQFFQLYKQMARQMRYDPGPFGCESALGYGINQIRDECQLKHSLCVLTSTSTAEDASRC